MCSLGPRFRRWRLAIGHGFGHRFGHRFRTGLACADADFPGGGASPGTAPPEVLGYGAITRYAPAGDFEGYVTYGIGVGRPMDTVPQTPVRVYEVEKIEQGQHLYVVAIQIDSTLWR
ncbi:hypothetical protein E3T40_13770 [Cryobacterium sp. TMT1-19]|uniref:hypothetical protein n=1 Tax=Cryobacterium sp. TMT1-19 TaxID=1259231 RepID=UPI00106DB2F3|nr:hypothetical protein [Cryobacterium sp. TMT1-19]TFD31823.1 hypothetical protein E3T40_13770 [Cryobacterium sp. TMT1-19]